MLASSLLILVDQKKLGLLVRGSQMQYYCNMCGRLLELESGRASQTTRTLVNTDLQSCPSVADQNSVYATEHGIWKSAPAGILFSLQYRS